MMFKTSLNRLGFLVLALAVSCAPAVSQETSMAPPPADASDAAPMPESGTPDPLAPPDKNGPAPLAPGAAPSPAASISQGETDPVVELTRQLLDARSPGRELGARQDLAAAIAFYKDRRAPVWTDKDGFTARGKQAADEIKKADEWGLSTADFDVPNPQTPPASKEALADAEARLALAVLKYARHARGGRLEPSAVSRKFDQKPTIFEPRSVLDGIAASSAADAYLRGLHPAHPQFEKLRQALVAARAASAGEKTPGHGGAGVQQIIVNMERWRWMPQELGGFYVWDSIPDQTTSVVEGGKVVMSEKIVVGKLSSPTPIFSADMLFIIFHPSWGVPPGMKSAELAPKLRDTGGGWFSSKPLASDVLKAHGLQTSRGGVPVDPDKIDWEKVNIQDFEFTQGPGPTNVLGAVKFRFPNKHDVYMHDTPERNLFGGSVRAFSHGCMRVQNPMHLADVLLSHDKGWSSAQIKDAARRGVEVKLTTPIPVHVTYFTASVEDDGKLVTRPDIYGLDSRVGAALFGREARSMPTGALRSVESSAPSARKTAPSRSKHAARRNPARTEQKPSNPFAGLFGE